MLKNNEYFDGKVKSIGFSNAEGKVTAGVMDIGEYEFGTSSKEYMTVTCGKLIVKLPGGNEWKEYNKGETFIIEANQKFQVKAEEQASYICIYE